MEHIGRERKPTAPGPLPARRCREGAGELPAGRGEEEGGGGGGVAGTEPSLPAAPGLQPEVAQLRGCW